VQCNREAIGKRLKMGLVAGVDSVKSLADDRPLAGVCSRSIPRIAVEANSGLNHRDILISHARLNPECYRSRSWYICLQGKEIT
jgi:hypothetical protein